MSTADEFSRVLAEAGEDQPAELPFAERVLAEMRARVAEFDAERMAQWQQKAAMRQAMADAYERANEAAGIEGRPPLESYPWLGMTPPKPTRIW